MNWERLFTWLLGAYLVAMIAACAVGAVWLWVWLITL